MREVQLVDISKLGLDSQIKKFSYSFICGKGYSPPSGGRIAFCLQSAAPAVFARQGLLLMLNLTRKFNAEPVGHFLTEPLLERLIAVPHAARAAGDVMCVSRSHINIALA